jgi:hypothetical protein
MPVLDGLKRLTKTRAFAAPTVALITSVNVGNDHILAKEYCNVFGPYGASSTLLDKASLEKILANLIAVEELDRDAFGGFLANVCGIAPLAIVSFFEARIAHAQKLEDSGQDTDYEPIPSSFSWSTLSAARRSSDYETALRGFRDLISVLLNTRFISFPFFGTSGPPTRRHSSCWMNCFTRRTLTIRPG